MSHFDWRRVAGFTLVELIMVLVVMGTLAGVGIGRMPNKASYTEQLAADEWLAALRLAQLTAMARGQPSAPVAVVITDVGSGGQPRYQFSFSEGTQLLRAAQDLEGGDLSLRDSDSDFVTPCANLTPVVPPLTLFFNAHGNRAQATGADLMQSHRICVGDTTLCISASGFAYQGSCI